LCISKCCIEVARQFEKRRKREISAAKSFNASEKMVQTDLN
jgi:hypothetical protein